MLQVFGINNESLMSFLMPIIKLIKIIRRLQRIPISLWFYDIGYSCSISRKYIVLPHKKNITIGSGCSIMEGFRIETVETYAGVKYHPLIRIGNNVAINQNFHCTCAESIIIESGVSITANCGIFDIVHPYEDLNKNPRCAKISTDPIIIGEDSLIGMNSVIMPGVHLGKHTIVGANSTVMKGCYPDNIVLAGSPAKIIKKYDTKAGQWVHN